MSYNHYSTTSSVYSSADTEVGFKSSEQIILEENEDTNSISSQEFNNPHFPNRFTNSNSSEPSFTSINNSILNNNISNSSQDLVNSKHTIHNFVDDDVTPKIPVTSSYNDEIDINTPVLREKASHLFQSQSANNLDVNYLPQQNMSSKFKRLSYTLQSSNFNASNDSQNFMNKFNNNVRSSFNTTTPNNRTSTYYNKINESVPQSDHEHDDYVEDDSHLSNKNNIESDISSISNRSSLINTDDSNSNSRSNSLSGDPPKFNVKNQTPESEFHFLTSNGSHTQFPNQTKQVPLKVIRNQSVPIQDDIPARADLISRPQQNRAGSISSNGQSSGLNISYDSNTSAGDFLEQDIKESSKQLDRPAIQREKSAQEQVSETFKNAINVEAEEDDLSTLFVRALHPFDSSTLQSEADASICLAFEKDDLAVVHTIDESGWGEVTLIETLQRGWVPMNYFKFAIDDTDEDDFDDSDEIDDEVDVGRIPNNHFLKPLFNACGKFLINPLSHKNRKGKFTFSIKVVNSIRDGVRVLLQETDCLSRSNEIVTKRPIVRKTRKSLLADWYNLMTKASDFKGTSDYNKIEILTLMVFQVIRKAISFLQVWSIESKQIIKKENERKLQNDMNTYPLLSTPPLAKQRVTEINTILYSYLGMIIGRLDLIEHNSVGCDLLETLTHHIILLLRELLFISKTGSDFSSEKPADLDNSLDSLLSLVSDLVTAVKSLVVKTLNETYEDQKYQPDDSPILNDGLNKEYYYTQEGGELIQISSKMIKAIGSTVSSIRKLLEITGNFKLNAQRAYPDYSKMQIEPNEFIKKCSIGIAKSNTIRNRQLKNIKPQTQNASNRFSIMRSGMTGELGLTPGGAGLLHDALITNVDGAFSNDKEFQQFTNNTGAVSQFQPENELLVDAKGNLLGASFKGLVYTLTNENSPPEYFFVSTFFICFRSFSNGSDFIEELISRFDISNSYSRDPNLQQSVNLDLKIKNRRRLISKMFQLWLESYWNYELDNPLLPTLMNFFNEGIIKFLPLDSMKLIEVAAKLSSRPVTEGQRNRKPRNNKQLVARSITATRLNRKNSFIGGTNEFNQRYSMVDGYELSKINTNSSTTSSIKSMSLSLPLGIGNQTSSATSLLTKGNISTIEKLNLTYRAIIGDGWCPANYINAKKYIPLELKGLLPNWYNLCDQSWVLSNYRPNLLDFNGLELAKQLTLIESTIFCSIKPEELLNDNYTTKKAHLKLAPNVRQSLLFTNCLSGYVIESVLQPKANNKMRLNVVKTWLKVAISCLYLRNFNSLAAIITSLQSHLITRLTKLWSELSDKYKELYDYLSGIIHPDKNYSVYRTKLRNFLVSNEYNIPVVPYFHLFLQDLTFISEGNSNHRKGNDFLNKKLINIDKYLKISRIIADIESLQISYDNGGAVLNAPELDEEITDHKIIAVPALHELVLLELWKVCQLNKKEEDRAWKLSCLIHPRDVN